MTQIKGRSLVFKGTLWLSPTIFCKLLFCCIILFPYVNTGRSEEHFPCLSCFELQGRETKTEHQWLRERAMEDFFFPVWCKHISFILQVCHMFLISWTVLHVFVFYSCRAAAVNTAESNQCCGSGDVHVCNISFKTCLYGCVSMFALVWSLVIVRLSWPNVHSVRTLC